MEDQDNPHFWLGWLAGALNTVARDPDVPRQPRKQAQRSLKAFLDSPCAAETLHDQLERNHP